MEKASVEDLFNKPLHPYTQGLLKSLVCVNQKNQRLKAISGNPPLPGQKNEGCPFAPRCLKAQEICHRQLPDLKESNNHAVRCWFAEESV